MNRRRLRKALLHDWRLTSRCVDPHSFAQRDVSIDRANPVLQLLEAQAVADFAVRPNHPQLDLPVGQFIVQPPVA